MSVCSRCFLFRCYMEKNCVTFQRRWINRFLHVQMMRLCVSGVHIRCFIVLSIFNWHFNQVVSRSKWKELETWMSNWQHKESMILNLVALKLSMDVIFLLTFLKHSIEKQYYYTAFLVSHQLLSRRIIDLSKTNIMSHATASLSHWKKERDRAMVFPLI